MRPSKFGKLTWKKTCCPSCKQAFGEYKGISRRPFQFARHDIKPGKAIIICILKAFGLLQENKGTKSQDNIRTYSCRCLIIYLLFFGGKSRKIPSQTLLSQSEWEAGSRLERETERERENYRYFDRPLRLVRLYIKPGLAWMLSEHEALLVSTKLPTSDSFLFLYRPSNGHVHGHICVM